jgi:hypothetical protein
MNIYCGISLQQRARLLHKTRVRLKTQGRFVWAQDPKPSKHCAGSRQRSNAANQEIPASHTHHLDSGRSSTGSGPLLD